ncbi:MAG TPA: hypothetical protein VKU00_12730 [Chthonomonadaceae bacterium]|nr:hypothetical protein [Chthonomonadaceae bacterium]
MNDKPLLPLKIIPDGDLWLAVDALCTVRAESSSRELLEDSLPLIVDAIQTAAAMRVQMARTGMIYRYDADWIA